MTIVDPDSAQLLQDITLYQEVLRLAYRPDGRRLAAAVCAGNRVVELEPPGYAEVAAPVTAASCPWALGYSPDGASLAAAIPFRPQPTAALFGHLSITGPQPLDRDMGLPLPAIAYRPGGGELAVATPSGLAVLSTAAGYPSVTTVPRVFATSLAYTTDGARLLAGTGAGFVVLDAAQGYALLSSDTGGAVTDIAVAPSGGWVAMVRGNAVSVRRAPDLVEATQLTSTAGFKDAEFAPGGALLAVAEQSAQVRRFQVASWQELAPIAVTGPVAAIAFRPRAGPRLPVLFVHGHSGNSGAAWFAPADGTSVAAALSANPQLRIDAFYLELPVHDGTANLDRSIAEDAQDILAAIEGGADSRGRVHVGIIDMPAYQGLGRVAIVGYSQGTLSSRFYLKNLMGSRRSGALTVSEFVALAAPNHGVGDAFSCHTFLGPSEPDRTLRQLCAGRTAVVTTETCGQCPPGAPVAFTNNVAGDETFIADLNGHPLADSCSAAGNAGEAPFSRPTRADGVLYVSLFAPDDELVGAGTQAGDCFGRRLARNLAPDADNREIAGVPSLVHANFPHFWPTICMALRTVVDHQAPDLATACTGLTPPP